MTKQDGMNMMIRDNNASCSRNRSISTAPLITSAVHKSALQESMPPPTQTHFPSLYNYTGKSSHIQPANSLSNHANFYNPITAHKSSHSNLAQYPLLNPRLTPLMPPHQASFHSFLNLKQAISSALASPNHDFNNFSAISPPSSALPFLSNDHISTANLDAALQASINDPLMGIDLMNVSTTAALVPLSSVTTTQSTTPTTSIFNRTTASLALQELRFNHTNDQTNHGDDHQFNGIQSANDKNMSIFSKDQQELQPFGSSTGASACQGIHQMHAGAILEDGQLMQLMSSSSRKGELVSDNFKMKGEDDPPSASSWAAANRSSFLEPSGDDQPYWNCNPSATWHDDLSS